MCRICDTKKPRIYLGIFLKMVVPARIELAFQVPQTCVLPLNYGTIRAGGVYRLRFFCQQQDLFPDQTNPVLFSRFENK